MYYDINNNKTMSLRQIREANPNVSFPKEPTDALLEGYGYKKIVYTTEVLATNLEYSQVIETPVDMSSGSPVVTRQTVDLPIEEVNRIKAKKASQYLSDTDWVIVKMNEESLKGNDVTPLLVKYADIISERENKRLTINQLEG